MLSSLFFSSVDFAAAYRPLTHCATALGSPLIGTGADGAQKTLRRRGCILDEVPEYGVPEYGVVPLHGASDSVEPPQRLYARHPE